MWKTALLLIGFVLLLGSGCGGGDGSKEGSAAGTHSNKDGAPATKADLDAALKKSFVEALAEALGKPSPSPPE